MHRVKAITPHLEQSYVIPFTYTSVLTWDGCKMEKPPSYVPTPNKHSRRTPRPTVRQIALTCAIITTIWGAFLLTIAYGLFGVR